MTDKATVLRDLRPLLDLVHESFEVGTGGAKEFFESRHESIEPTLAAALTRYFAGRHLRDRGQVVEEFATRDLANIGLELRYGQYIVRIWKTADGDVPPPGRSRAKQRFLSPHEQFEMEFPDFPDPECINIAVLWRVNGSYQLSDMYVARPKAMTSPYGAVECYWCEPVLHPALVATAPIGATEILIGDLPFELNEADEQTSEHVG